MTLTAQERSEALVVIRRGLDEDLRGPERDHGRHRACRCGERGGHEVTHGEAGVAAGSTWP